jgi:hypothetical protein
MDRWRAVVSAAMNHEPCHGHSVIFSFPETKLIKGADFFTLNYRTKQQDRIFNCELPYS